VSRYALTDIISEVVGHPIPERGQNAYIRCPFHQDRLPSLSINLDNGLWICFGCGLKGGLHSLATRLEREIDDVQVTLRSIEASGGYAGYEEDLPDFKDLAATLRKQLFEDQPRPVIDFILSRELRPAVVKHFGLGWDRDGQRIAFPYYRDDAVFGIKYRDRLGNKTSQTGSKRGIYNVDGVSFRPTVILCEGESDTLAVWSRLTASSLPDTVKESIGVGGIPGVSVSKSQWETWALDLFWAKRVFIAFDADDAGDRGSEIPLEVLGDKGIRLRPTKGKDMTDHFMNGGSLNDFEDLGAAFGIPDRPQA
jgi:hypothetical protein